MRLEKNGSAICKQCERETIAVQRKFLWDFDICFITVSEYNTNNRKIRKGTFT